MCQHVSIFVVPYEQLEKKYGKQQLGGYRVK